MAMLHRRVEGSQIMVDEATAEERAELEAEIERGRAEIAAGAGISVEELLARVRAS
jgi:hypothetical protein